MKRLNSAMIYIPRDEVLFLENPISFSTCIQVLSEEALDSIIEQCRDIKLKLIEEAKKNAEN